MIGKKYEGEYSTNIGISDISDHLPLILNIDNINPYKKAARNITTRTLDSKNMELLNERIMNEDWERMLNGKNTNESFTMFHSTI